MIRSIQFKWAVRLVSAILFLTLPAKTFAQPTAKVVVDPSASGIIVPNDFLGLSFETGTLSPDSSQQYHFFRSDNKPLIQLFQTLGVRNLRIGGNTADTPGIQIPTAKDIDEFFAFAQAAHVKVIYTLRLRQSSPTQAASTAKYLMDHYGPDLQCLAIGNEPNTYQKNSLEYIEEIKQYVDAIHAPEIAPAAKICGPSDARAWPGAFANAFGSAPWASVVTTHTYPGGSGRKVTDPSAARDLILSPDIEKKYNSEYRDVGPSAKAAGLPYRIEEANNFYNGGAKDVSNTLASALWGLNYLYWWASHGTAGVNFHTGDTVAAADTQTPCWYAIFWTAPGGYDVHPIAYAMKAFDIAGHGKLLPTKVESTGNMLTAYASVVEHDLYITILNNDHGATASIQNVEIEVPPGYRKSRVIYLAGPGFDVSATSDITLGGKQIKSDGSWNGSWSRLSAHAHRLTVEMHPAAVAIVRMSKP